MSGGCWEHAWHDANYCCQATSNNQNREGGKNLISINFLSLRKQHENPKLHFNRLCKIIIRQSLRFGSNYFPLTIKAHNRSDRSRVCYRCKTNKLNFIKLSCKTPTHLPCFDYNKQSTLDDENDLLLDVNRKLAAEHVMINIEFVRHVRRWWEDFYRAPKIFHHTFEWAFERGLKICQTR